MSYICNESFWKIFKIQIESKENFLLRKNLQSVKNNLFPELIEFSISCPITNLASLFSINTKIQSHRYENECFESGPLWNIAELVRYNSISGLRRVSYHETLQRIERTIFWENFQLYVLQYDRDTS